MGIRAQLELFDQPAPIPQPCTNCVERARADRLAADVLDNETEMRSYKRVIRELKRDRKRERETSPNFRAARDIFDYWVRATGRSEKRTVFGEDRQEVVLKALGEYPPERCKHAIEGAVIEPFKRGDQVYDELRVTLGKSANLEHFEAVFERAQNGHRGGTTRQRAARVSGDADARRGLGHATDIGRMVELPAHVSRETWNYELECCAYPCGHPRLFHQPDEQGRLSCRQCGCVEFDDLDARVAAFHRQEQDRLARERAKRLNPEEQDGERSVGANGRRADRPLYQAGHSQSVRELRDAGDREADEAAAQGQGR